MKIVWALIVVVLAFLDLASGYHYEQGPVPKERVAPCPGLYCGRNPLNETHLSQCQPCHRGWRVVDKNSILATSSNHSKCQPCQSQPGINDWLFLTCHPLLVLILHWVSINMTSTRQIFTKDSILLHLSALVEVLLAVVVTILVNEPFGSLDLVMCDVSGLTDWYSWLKNPSPNYGPTLHCTHEVVYPRYTMVFQFLALCLGFLLILRPLVSTRLSTARSKNAIYKALYFLPGLALIHAVFGGVIYVAYPYIVFVMSIVSSAIHFAFCLDQRARALFMGVITSSRNIMILLGHWLLHAFGILAITQLSDILFHLLLLLLVPLPSLFYIFTARFTDPANFVPESRVS